MLKKERLVKIAHKVNQNGIITIQEIMDELGVSDMTARRDLDELEKSGKLLRVHGGAQSLSFSMDHELSHIEKSSVQIEEKKRIAHKAATLINEGESQQIALDNSKIKYLLADNKKFNRADFYIYYDLFNFDALITDNTIDEEVLTHYKQYVQIMTV